MNIKVIKAEKVFVFRGKTNLSLLEQLRQKKIYVTAVCGGTGSCGKCKVQMLEGITEANETERAFFSEEELADGFRLACKTVPQTDCTIVIDDFEEKQFQIVTECFIRKNEENLLPETISEHSEEPSANERMQEYEMTHRKVSEEYVIGIDLGTTTIAMQLVEKNSAQLRHTLTFINRQRSYGADVISRIQAAKEGKGEILQELILEDLYQGIEKLIRESKVNPQQIKEIGIAGNTTMGHLLMGN